VSNPTRLPPGGKGSRRPFAASRPRREPPEVPVLLERREAEAPSEGFLKSLLRSSRREATGNTRGMVAGVPLVPVARNLEGNEVELACGHVVDRPPLAKVRPGKLPPLVPCVFCGEEERPATPAAVCAALAKATPDELLEYERVIRERRPADERQGAA
jgi:hypothetical protein